MYVFMLFRDPELVVLCMYIISVGRFLSAITGGMPKLVSRGLSAEEFKASVDEIPVVDASSVTRVAPDLSDRPRIKISW